ncbi:MAG TPA: tRNA pseudouridine(55) synthase TruB [Steroidobacteraceae bacterium]|nr:tRNA pseudouridine(55) synthase TruB [Steroidobacteraceae bacterium]
MSLPATDGLLLLDKPLGMSSNTALQRVKRLAGGVKAGHTGSLDPLATGMLPICLGEATKLAGEMLSQRKSYEFELLLGERSETGDAEGSIVERCAVPVLTETDVAEVLLRFHGPSRQIPPMYSALKRQGQPLYRLARAGITVEREPRDIVIESLQLVSLSSPALTLRALCSKGTYVRVLAEDIARALGTCGRLQRLRRLFVEPFGEESMLTLDELEQHTRDGRAWPLLTADRAVGHLPALHLATGAVRALSQGKTLPLAAPRDGQWRLYDEARTFVGLGLSDADGTLRVQRLFCAAQQ